MKIVCTKEEAFRIVRNCEKICSQAGVGCDECIFFNEIDFDETGSFYCPVANDAFELITEDI